MGGPMNTYVIMCYMLGQYSPYTFTIATLDTTDPASLLTIHLYMYCPIASVVSVVYDVLSLPTVVQLLPELLSQEYTIVPIPLALHAKVIVPFTGTLSPTGCSVILGGPVNNNNQGKYGKPLQYYMLMLNR